MAETSAPTPTCLLGKTLADATATHFFTWFNLEVSEPPRGATTRFRPNGDKFRDLVEVEAHVDGGGRIDRIDVVLRRSFIEDRRDGMFAADIAKSFLQAALPPEHLRPMQHLVDTIAYGGKYDVPILAAATGGRPPEIRRDSAPYGVWLGWNSHWRRPDEDVALHLENFSDQAGPAVRIGVAAKGSAAGA